MVDVHSEAIRDNTLRDLMTFVDIKEPLVQIETMYQNTKTEMLSVQVPVFAYPTIKDLYKRQEYEVYSGHHYFPKETLLSIVETFKSRLLDSLLQFNDKLDWNMELSDDKNKNTAKTIINNVYNVHAAVANMGDGSVETQDITLTE